ncbi:tetratricopeptide repeat protein [Halalkalibacter lacteus]|uniref:tetratricopeptide repeat protein n=1 Tax=Halalkalibacter lacteus TaxID=3090663 RepID=UPI002FCBC046
MKEWLSSWNTIYEKIEKKWSLLSQSEQANELAYLEETAGMLLDKWTELDEKINELKIDDHSTDRVVSYHSKGTTYYELDMFAEAARTLKMESSTGEKDELRRLYLGYAFLFSEQLEKAKETFLYIIQVSYFPYLKHFALVGLGCVQTRQQRIEDAIVSFQNANQLTSTNDVVYNLGICYFTNEAFHLAKDYFASYVEQEPEDGEALFYLGCCQWETGEHDAAWSSWTTSIHLLDSKEALLSLAYVCEWHGFHQAAIHCYKRVQEKYLESVNVLHGIAWNYALLDDKENALKAFREALFLDPNNANVCFSLNWLRQGWPEVSEWTTS